MRRWRRGWRPGGEIQPGNGCCGRGWRGSRSIPADSACRRFSRASRYCGRHWPGRRGAPGPGFELVADGVAHVDDKSREFPVIAESHVGGVAFVEEGEHDFRGFAVFQAEDGLGNGHREKLARAGAAGGVVAGGHPAKVQRRVRFEECFSRSTPSGGVEDEFFQRRVGGLRRRKPAAGEAKKAKGAQHGPKRGRKDPFLKLKTPEAGDLCARAGFSGCDGTAGD